MPWSAPGSSTRAQISSSSSRGAVAPRISVRPAASRSAARTELGRAEPGRLGDAAARPGPPGTSISPVAGGVGHRGDDHEVAQPAQQVLGEAARVLAGLDHLVDDPEHGGAVAGRERVDHLVEQRVGRVAEQPGRDVVGHPVGAGAAEQLVEDGERVAGRPAARADDERERGRLDRDALLARTARRGTSRACAAGSAGTGSGGCATGWSAMHLLGLGRGEDELDVLRRLLDQLEQRVERRRASPCGPRR